MEVKFYRLGWESPISKSTYDTYVTNVIGDNGDGGGIIFAKVDSSIVNISTYLVQKLDDQGEPIYEDGEPVMIEAERIIEEPPTYYINAAGIEYKVADADVLTNLYKKYLDLIDDSSDSYTGLYTNPSSVHKWIQDAMKDYVLTAEKVYAIVDPSNKVYDYESSTYLNIVEKSADGIDVSVRTKEGMNSSLLFAVDLDRIYLPTGVHRTEKIGWLDEVEGDPELEGVGMSVKELLEYYLVKERFPELIPHPGSAKFTSFTLSNTWDEISNKILFTDTNNYIIQDTLIEVDAPLKINNNTPITGTLSFSEGTGDWDKQKNPEKSYIDGITINGYTENPNGTPVSSTDSKEAGHLIPISETIKYGESTPKGTINVNATYTYSYSDAGLGGDISLYIIQSNNTSIYSSNFTKSGDHSFTYEIDNIPNNITIKQGANTFKLNTIHDAAVTRSINPTLIPAVDTIYPLSNSKHIHPAEEKMSIDAVTISNAQNANVTPNHESTKTYTGVYPIYTNCRVNQYYNKKKSGYTEYGLGESTENCTWPSGTYYGGIDINNPGIVKYPILLNPQSGSDITIYINMGDNSNESTKNNVPIIYVPHYLGKTNIALWLPDGKPIVGTIYSEVTSWAGPGSFSFKKDINTVNIRYIAYDKFVFYGSNGIGGSGEGPIKVKIS